MPQPEWAEQEADCWWEATAVAVKTAVRQVDKNRIGAVGITHQRESFVPLDKNMKPLRNGILWLDTRATAQVEKLKLLGAEKVHRITGLYPNLYASNVKIMWLRENEPRLFGSVYKFLDVDRPLYKDHTKMKELVKSCEILKEVEKITGNLG